MATNLQVEATRIQSQMDNYVTNLKSDLEHNKKRLKEEQAASLAASAQGDRSENAEFQIAQSNIARLIVAISGLTDVIDSYNHVAVSYTPMGVAVVGSTLLVEDTTNNTGDFSIKLYPAGLGNAKIGAISILAPLGAAVLGKTSGDTVVVKTHSGEITYVIKEVY